MMSGAMQQQERLAHYDSSAHAQFGRTSSSGRPPKGEQLSDPTALRFRISPIVSWGFPEWGSAGKRPRTRYLRINLKCPAAIASSKIPGSHGDVYLESPVTDCSGDPSWETDHGNPWEAVFILDYAKWRARCGAELRVTVLDRGLIGGETLVGSFTVEISSRDFWSDASGTPEEATFALRGKLVPGIEGSVFPHVGKLQGLGMRTLGPVVGDMTFRMHMQNADYRHFVPIDKYDPARVVKGSLARQMEDRVERWSAVHRKSSRLTTPTHSQMQKYRQKPQPPINTQFRESGAVNNLQMNLTILEALSRSSFSNHARWKSFGPLAVWTEERGWSTQSGEGREGRSQRRMPVLESLKSDEALLQAL